MDSAAPLLEREREVAAVDGAIASAVDGKGSLLLVEGPAGIGKTSLLGEAAARAAERGLLVRQARGAEMERDMAFGVARQLFEPLVRRASDSERDVWLSGAANQARTALGLEAQ